MHHYITRKYTRRSRGTLWTRHSTEITFRADDGVGALRLRGRQSNWTPWQYDSGHRVWTTSPDGLTRLCAELVTAREEYRTAVSDLPERE